MQSSGARWTASRGETRVANISQETAGIHRYRHVT
jgi:hypothetical protein